jgi:hypothetical protein
LYSDTDKIRLLNNDNKMYPKNDLYISLQIPKINLLPTQLAFLAQAVSRWPLAVEAGVRASVSPCGVCVGQSGSGIGFS